MKKLGMVNPWVWIITITFSMLAIAFLIFVLTIQVEETYAARLVVDPLHSNSLIADSVTAYKIDIGDQITFLIDDKYYYCTIGNMFWDQDSNIYFEVKGLNFDLLPGTQLDVKIIFDTHSFGSTLFA